MNLTSVKVQTQTGKIFPHQTRSNIDHYFEVPAGTTLIEVNFECAKVDMGKDDLPNQVSLSLYDPKTGRGARHNNIDQRIKLTNNSASKGYIVGPLLPGNWLVSIDVHRLTPPMEVNYELKFCTDNAKQSMDGPTYKPAKCAPRGAGWYRGDLHGHTSHSDASWDVADLVNYARQIGLDFITLTDHNTTSAIPEGLSLADDELLILGGMELTTFHGHCLVIGTHDWVEWRATPAKPMSTLASDVLATGALFIIAHPACIGYPICTGCDWQYSDMMPGVAAIIEVWNGDWSGRSQNELALRMYYNWLNQGHELVATAGTDIHDAFKSSDRPGYNFVYSDSLEANSLIDAIKKGRLYISSGPKIYVIPIKNQLATAIGALFPHEKTLLRIHWDMCPSDAIIWLVQKSEETDIPCKSTPIGEGSGGVVDISFDPSGTFDWVAIEVRDQAHELYALTNPTFFRKKI